MLKTLGSSDKRKRLFLGLFIALLTIVFLLSLEAHYRLGGPWSSETMMQTVSLADLRDQPLRSLWNLHIQPPLFDAIRAVLARIWFSNDSMAMLLQVDGSLYVLWAMVSGMMVFVIFWWLSGITNNTFAVLSALFFSAHPALIFYATLLDTTILSAFLILAFYYLLWLVKEARVFPASILAIAFLLLFFTRSIFQWQWLLLLALSLVLMKFPYRKLIVFLAIAGIAVGLYTLKQVSLFNLSSTSSLTGYNLCHSINACNGAGGLYFNGPLDQGQVSPSKKPKVLTTIRKVNDAFNFNNEYYLTINRQLEQQYRTRLLSLISSPLQLVDTYLYNLRIYLSPSSQYSQTSIVDGLPQRAAYDTLFSSPVLPLLLAMAFAFWLSRARRSDFWSVIGFCLPAVFIIFLSIVGDRGENNRFKFFIEPVLFVFLASQAYAAGKKIIEYVKDRKG